MKTAATDKSRYKKILRWMANDLQIAGSVYRTKRGLLRVDPGISVSKGRVSRHSRAKPPGLHEWEANSVAGLVACCYIDALGKVLREGAKRENGENLFRFKLFIREHMRDFAAECANRGGRFSAKTLYGTYRCGFVHQFGGASAVWDRRGSAGRYWFQYRNRPGINIDRLVQGSLNGIVEFEREFDARVERREVNYRDFLVWLGIQKA